MLRLLVLSLVGTLVLVGTPVVNAHGDNKESNDQAESDPAHGVIPAEGSASDNKSTGASTTMAPMNGSMNLTTASVQISNSSSPLPTAIVNSTTTNATMAPSNVTSTTSPSSSSSPTAFFSTVLFTACGLVWLTHLS